MSLESQSELRPQLGLFPATSLVIGCVVGSGIFVSSSSMAHSLQSAPLLLGVWLLAGIFTVFGALTQCELVGQMPGTGGLYTYLREIYGDAAGFFYGWANLTVGNTGSIAAIAYIFASYLSAFVPLPHLSPALEQLAVPIPYLGSLFPLQNFGAKCVAAILLIGLTLLNVRGVRFGTWVQSISMSAKMLALGGVSILAFGLGHAHGGDVSHWFQTRTTPVSGLTWMAGITAALSGAFWSYDGWGTVAYIGDEVKNPVKTLPRAILLGSFCFIALYLVMNLAYLYVLPVGALASAPEERVASSVAFQVLGRTGSIAIAILVMLTAFDAVNASILTCGRVFYAMAVEGLFFPSVAKVHPKYGTPSRALYHQLAWCLILLFSGSFDLVTSMYVFVSWGIYLLMAIGVFVMRARHPNRERPFQIPGYPWVPILFIAFAFSFLVLTLIGDWHSYASGEAPAINSLMGIAFVLLGTPLYLYLKPKKSLRVGVLE